jgi:8-oxo-dGTP diphosphatase
MARPATPLLTVDCVVVDARDRVLLIQRGSESFKGTYALPGGFVDLNETVEDACRREVMEETGVKIGKLRLIGVYSKPGRDPRGPTVSIAYMALIRAAVAKGGDDASNAEWVSDWKSLPLAFDHKQILRDAAKLTV